MSDNCNRSKGIVLGALVGGVLAGACVYFFKTKTGQKVIQDVSDRYQDLSNKLNGYVDEVQDTIKDHAERLTDRAKDTMDTFRSGENRDFGYALLVGGAVGALLGGGCALLCHTCPKHGPKPDLMDSISNQASRWKCILKDISDVMANRPNARASEPKNSSSIHDIVDFAVAGMDLWQSFKKSR